MKNLWGGTKRYGGAGRSSPNMTINSNSKKKVKVPLRLRYMYPMKRTELHFLKKSINYFHLQ